MFARVEYHLKQEESPAIITSSSGSLFQGALMQRIDPTYGDYLHESRLKPYSQYIECRQSQIMWTFHCLTEESIQKMIESPEIKNWETIHIEHKNIDLKICERRITKLSEEELMARTFFSHCPRTVKVQFVTPTSFKSNGSYQIYPSISHIFNSLINKFDAVSEQAKLASPEILSDLVQNTVTIGYNLRSTMFHIEGVKIPSFIGTMTLKLIGPQQLVNLTHMLLQFGTYSGVGIKTAMGMGGMRIPERMDRHAGKTI